MKRSKRASANMWWIIIGAVMAIIVLVILMVMFTGRTQIVEKELSTCLGGRCVSSGECNVGDGLIKESFECSNDPVSKQPRVCCFGGKKTTAKK